ncbi:MAG: SigB/SigF/SigG family RNA polymerase sigma factor [Clostridia bacterium]|nr:SigB/SigF/SigG family RNA polymerase sigma factor [Clostridia bacterium]
MDKNMMLLVQYKNGDMSARDKLCEENMGLVWNIVKRFSGGGVDAEDLAQTGAVGLLKAIDNFDVSFDVKFSTYAVPMIIGEIRRFLRDDGLIKVSRTLKQSAYKGYKAREELSARLGREPTMTEISERCGVSVEELVEAFEATAVPDSINREAYSDSDEEFADRLKSGDDEEKIVNKIAVENILSRLEPRERQILVLRYFKGKTQQEIAPIVGVSQVQVSRIEKKVFERIRSVELI